MLVQTKNGDDWRVLRPLKNIAKKIGFFRPELDSLPLYFYPGRMRNEFSPAMVPDMVPSDIAVLLPDIVHIHWIGYGFLRIESLKKFNRPIVWTLHDMWAFTGGCHYSDNCDRFQQDCGNCQQLNRMVENDLSRSVFKRKEKAWAGLDIIIVTPSSWLAECAKKSSLFKSRRIEVIHNGLDLTLFKPVEKTTTRKIWDLPINKNLILFGAMSATSDHRKGFDLLYEGLKQLAAKWLDKAELVVFGDSEPENPPDFGLPVHYLGRLHDDVSLSLLYAAADVMVVPSRQDNLPNTVVESLACGTPVVAFDIGGMPDMIDHQINGYLAKPFDVSDLVAGIDCVLSNENHHKELCINAREKAVACFDIKKVAMHYADLYESIV